LEFSLFQLVGFVTFISADSLTDDFVETVDIFIIPA
jgi:hypothetical protein